MAITPEEAREVVKSLRLGKPPSRSLDYMATGLEPLMAAIGEQLDAVKSGQADVKFLRGEYGAGKTFVARLVAEAARRRGFATSEVRITKDVPLHKLDLVYRSALESLATQETPGDAFRSIVDAWLYAVGESVTQIQGLEEDDPAFADAVEKHLEERLAELAATTPAFSQVLRAYHRASTEGNFSAATSLLAWLGGHGTAGPEARKLAGVSGKIESGTALAYLRGVLKLIRQAGYSGLVLVVDELETVQRRSATERNDAFETLHHLVDAVDGPNLAGLFLVVTGTKDLFEGLKGAKANKPLHQRIGVQFPEDASFDNLKQSLVRLQPFDRPRLIEVAKRVRAIYPSKVAERVAAKVSDPFVEALVDQVAGQFGGVSVTPRYFLRMLVDVLDRVDQHEGYDPARQFSLRIDQAELTPEELDAHVRTQAAPPAEDEPRKRRRLEG